MSRLACIIQVHNRQANDLIAPPTKLESAARKANRRRC